MPPQDPLTLAIDQLHSVGAGTLLRLKRLDIQNVLALLLHRPLRYEDRRQVTRLADVQTAAMVQVEGAIAKIKRNYRSGNVLITLKDETGELDLRFFSARALPADTLKEGQWMRAIGSVDRSKYGLQMLHPEYLLRDQQHLLPPLQAGLTPVYPLTDGLTQGRMRGLIQFALTLAKRGHHEFLDNFLRQALPELPDFINAIESLHHPEQGDLKSLAEGHHPALVRLATEELLAHQCVVQKRRSQRLAFTAPLISEPDALVDLLNQLPFQPTRAQRRVLQEVAADLARALPMARLVQGDVGSGKTVIAAFACLCAIRAGFQAALMVPTELLAEQHFKTLSSWLVPLGVRLDLIVGGKHKKRRQHLRDGSVQLAIGTHALFQDDIQFARLGLVVIDEQHRFGVRQRLQLWQKPDALVAHQLVLTATPIPRTLAQTLYSDLDVSVIDELPPNRKPIQTIAIPESRRHEVIARIGRACRQRRQAYWVCPLIESSEKIAAQAAEMVLAELQSVLQGVRIGLVHGRMKSVEKEAALSEFRQGNLDVLVATTVIEVGVDVPNASLMVIDNAERMGLAQLHQLRGRVGRGAAQSHCVLLYGKAVSQVGRQRLAVMRESQDGFVIAEKDLELRGAGEVLGVRQTGDLSLRSADLHRDRALIPLVQRLAREVVGKPEWVETLTSRWLPEGAALGSV